MTNALQIPLCLLIRLTMLMQKTEREELMMNKCIFCDSSSVEQKKMMVTTLPTCQDCKSDWSTDEKGICSKSHCFKENCWSHWTRDEYEPQPRARTMLASELILGNSVEREVEIMREEHLLPVEVNQFSGCKGSCELHGYKNCQCNT